MGTYVYMFILIYLERKLWRYISEMETNRQKESKLILLQKCNLKIKLKVKNNMQIDWITLPKDKFKKETQSAQN